MQSYPKRGDAELIQNALPEGKGPYGLFGRIVIDRVDAFKQGIIIRSGMSDSRASSLESIPGECLAAIVSGVARQFEENTLGTEAGARFLGQGCPAQLFIEACMGALRIFHERILDDRQGEH